MKGRVVLLAQAEGAADISVRIAETLLEGNIVSLRPSLASRACGASDLYRRRRRRSGT